MIIVTVKSELVDEQTLEIGLQALNPDNKALQEQQALRLVNAFDLPRFSYVASRKSFILRNESGVRSLHADAGAKGEMYRARLALVRQKLLRNQAFSPPLLVGGASAQRRQLSDLNSLLGSEGPRCVLGMLSQLEEGRWFLEDEHTTWPLDASQAAFTAGFFAEHCIVVAEGQLSPEGVFVCTALGMPPAEPRIESLLACPGIDWWGLGPASEAVRRYEAEQPDAQLAFLAEVHLDRPDVLQRLRTLFEGLGSGPRAYILLGAFSGRRPAQAAQFDALAEICAAFPDIWRESTLVLVPGPGDPDPGGGVLPRPPLPLSLVRGLRDRFAAMGASNNLLLASNPCRLRFGTKTIVAFREDLMWRLRRSVVVQPSGDYTLGQHLVKTILGQAHLLPVPPSVRPVYWAHDHALQLFPLPDLLVLADSSEAYNCNFSKCICINPSSFSQDYRFFLCNPLHERPEVEWSRID
jgi:DNA polymerase epsilon subunit 2